MDEEVRQGQGRMKRRLDVSAPAEADVEEIFQRIAAENLGAAVRFGHAARDCFRSLLDNPFLGREYEVRNPRLLGAAVYRCAGLSELPRVVPG